MKKILVLFLTLIMTSSVVTIAADKADDVRRHLLVSQFRDSSVELLGREAFPVQRQA